MGFLNKNRTPNTTSFAADSFVAHNERATKNVNYFPPLIIRSRLMYCRGLLLLNCVVKEPHFLKLSGWQLWLAIF
jgi:hypothetical protein